MYSLSIQRIFKSFEIYETSFTFLSIGNHHTKSIIVILYLIMFQLFPFLEWRAIIESIMQKHFKIRRRHPIEGIVLYLSSIINASNCFPNEPVQSRPPYKNPFSHSLPDTPKLH